MNDANNNTAAVCSAQTVNAPLCEARQGSAHCVLRNDASKEPNTEAVDGASNKTVGAWVGPLYVPQYSTGSTLESK